MNVEVFGLLIGMLSKKENKKMSAAAK